MERTDSLRFLTEAQQICSQNGIFWQEWCRQIWFDEFCMRAEAVSVSVLCILQTWKASQKRRSIILHRSGTRHRNVQMPSTMSHACLLMQCSPKSAWLRIHMHTSLLWLKNNCSAAVVFGYVSLGQSLSWLCNKSMRVARLCFLSVSFTVFFD